MHDSNFIYADFILTIQRLSQTFTALLKHECTDLTLSDINFHQALYMLYLVEQKDVVYIEDRKINRKNFYYTVNKLHKLEYINVEFNGKFIKNIDPTRKGQRVIDALHKIFDKQLRQLLFNGMIVTELSHILTLIYRFEKFWLNQIYSKIE